MTLSSPLRSFLFTVFLCTSPQSIPWNVSRDCGVTRSVVEVVWHRDQGRSDFPYVVPSWCTVSVSVIIWPGRSVEIPPTRPHPDHSGPARSPGVHSTKVETVSGWGTSGPVGPVVHMVTCTHLGQWSDVGSPVCGPLMDQERGESGVWGTVVEKRVSTRFV